MARRPAHGTYAELLARIAAPEAEITRVRAELAELRGEGNPPQGLGATGRVPEPPAPAQTRPPDWVKAIVVAVARHRPRQPDAPVPGRRPDVPVRIVVHAPSVSPDCGHGLAGGRLVGRRRTLARQSVRAEVVQHQVRERSYRGCGRVRRGALLGRTNPPDSEALRAEAVELARRSAQAIPARASELGGPAQTLRDRVARVADEAGQGPPGAFGARQGAGWARQRRENRVLRRERKFLKEAAAFVAEETLCADSGSSRRRRRTFRSLRCAARWASRVPAAAPELWSLVARGEGVLKHSPTGEFGATCAGTTGRPLEIRPANCPYVGGAILRSP